MGGQRKSVSVGQGIVVGIIGIGICIALWFFLGGNPDEVDASTKVERGAFASDEPNPEFQMMQEHLKKNK